MKSSTVLAFIKGPAGQSKWSTRARKIKFRIRIPLWRVFIWDITIDAWSHE